MKNRIIAAWTCLLGRPTIYRMAFTDGLKVSAECKFRIIDSSVFIQPTDDTEVIYAND